MTTSATAEPTDLLARERRKREKIKAQAARQQSQIRELEESLAASAAAAAAAQEAAEWHRGQLELLRKRHEAETARHDDELRQLQDRHAEENSTSREALTKVSLSLEAARLEAAGLRQALSREQLEAAERRAEAERLRASLAEATAASAESERAWDDLVADRRDGAGRLRELREANIRLQEKLAGAESRLAGLRDDCQAAAALAEERGRKVEELKERLAGSEAARAAVLEAPLNGGQLEASPARQSEEQLAAICERLERAEAAGRLIQAAAAPPQPSPLQLKLVAESESGGEATASQTERRRAEAAERALAVARAELAEARAMLGAQSRLPETAAAKEDGIIGDTDGGKRRRRHSVEAVEGAQKLDLMGETGEGADEIRHRPIGRYLEGRSGWQSGLWRTSYCTDDLEGLRRACLSLAAERDRLSGDCRHYRRLYEEEKRLRHRLTEEVRRLNCTDGRGRALRMMEADAAPASWSSPKIAGDLEFASYATYLRRKYAVT